MSTDMKIAAKRGLRTSLVYLLVAALLLPLAADTGTGAGASTSKVTITSIENPTDIAGGESGTSDIVDLTDVEPVVYSRSSWSTKTWYFSRDETRHFARYGNLPQLSRWSWGGHAMWVIRMGLWSHQSIARWWYDRGYCIKFTLSFVPWASQGMSGYRC